MPGGQGAHVNPRIADGVHADAVAQQRAAGLTLGRIHRDDAQGFVGEIVEKAPHNFIDQRRLTRATGAGDAQHRRVVTAIVMNFGEEAPDAFREILHSRDNL